MVEKYRVGSVPVHCSPVNILWMQTVSNCWAPSRGSALEGWTRTEEMECVSCIVSMKAHYYLASFVTDVLIVVMQII